MEVCLGKRAEGHPATAAGADRAAGPIAVPVVDWLGLLMQVEGGVGFGYAEPCAAVGAGGGGAGWAGCARLGAWALEVGERSCEDRGFGERQDMDGTGWLLRLRRY